MTDLAASSHRPRTQILDAFLRRAALFSALYFFIGNVYQQAYLRTLGFKIALIDPNHFLPSFGDIYVLSYVAILGLVISRFPDRWYNHIAEMINISAWRWPRDNVLRFFGFVLGYLFFFLTNAFEIILDNIQRILKGEPLYIPHRLELFFPTASFFSSGWTASIFFIIALIISSVYVFYARIRSIGLLEVEKHHRRVMSVILQVGIPLLLLHTVTTLGLSLPQFYGTFKAGLDADRMFGTPHQRVMQLEGIGATCLDPSLNCASQSCVYNYRNRLPEAHYLGQIDNGRLFLVFNSRREKTVCLLRETSIQYLLIGDH